MDNVTGSMEFLSAVQLTADMEGLDAECKAILRSKEALAVILQETLEEYAGYSRQEIMDFIEDGSMEEGREVSPGRTNTQVRGDNAEFAQLNEKASFFDLLFKVKNPKLSRDGFLVNLHVDVEPQKSYRPGYPLEKRGMYYLARQVSSQLSLVTGQTDYGGLEKCCGIWICLDDIPKKEQYSISFYETVNTKNIGTCKVEKENYDLMKLVVIRLGDMMYNGASGSEGYRLLRFLNAVMHPHREDFMDTLAEYVDFSKNEELWKEGKQVLGIGQMILKEGFEKGIERGIEKGIEKGVEKGMRAFVLDNLEEKVPKDRVIQKLQIRFGLPQEKAELYYDEYSREE